MDHGPGAHGAWLQRHVEFATGEAVILERLRGGAHGDNFGVRSRVEVAQNAVLAAPDDLSAVERPLLRWAPHPRWPRTEPRRWPRA